MLISIGDGNYVRAADIESMSLCPLEGNEVNLVVRLITPTYMSVCIKHDSREKAEESLKAIAGLANSALKPSFPFTFPQFA